MAWDDDGLVGEGEDPILDRAKDGIHAPAPQVRASDASEEECVAGEDVRLHRLPVSIRGHAQAETARRVTWRVEDLAAELSDREFLAIADVTVDREGPRNGEAEHPRLDLHHVVERLIRGVQQHPRAGRDGDRLGPTDVVEVRVSVEERLAGEVQPLQGREDELGIVTRVDDQGTTCLLAP